MTASDPGLVDLIAAHHRNSVSETTVLDPETRVHTYWIECTCVCGAETSVEVAGDRESALRLADALHVASIVEQRNDGRAAELRDVKAERDVLKSAVARAWSVIPSYSVESGGKATAEQVAWLDGTKHVQRQLYAALRGKS